MPDNNYKDMAAALQDIAAVVTQTNAALAQLNTVQALANVGTPLQRLSPNFKLMLALSINMSQTQSPLLVHFNSPDSDALSFTSPLEGVLFDLLGINAKPAPHTKYQVSWLEGARGNLFITLPNIRGEVNGIDQLFGNNTLGPDGKLSPDGFAALAKFDSNQDGYIDQADSIFQRLRLWEDRNRDGVAQARELRCLECLDVEVIDLNFDKNYLEIDKWGNQIKYKSVLKTKDQNLHFVFDVWLRFVD